MKPSSPARQRKPVNHTAARNAAIINQLTTPGLGSLMAGRWVTGGGQLVLALAGAFMVTVWFVKILIQYYGQISGNVEVKPVGWIGATGGILFVVSWLWALVTSVSLYREAQKNAAAKFEKAQSQLRVPPRLDEPPTKPGA